MDRADEQAVSRSSAARPSRSSTPPLDPLLQLLRGPLGERERDDRRRWHPVGEQVDDPLRDDLGLAGAGRGDDLQMAAAVLDGLKRGASQLRYRSRYSRVSS